MIKSGIYLIVNLINNMVYVGSAVNLCNRWYKHNNDLNNNRHHSKYLQAAWNKYGAENFEFKALQLVEDKTKLLEIEQAWINWLNCIAPKGYNLTPTAGSTYGYRFKHKSKRPFKPHSEERKRKIGLAQLGKRHSEQSRLKITNSKIGKKHSEETKLKLSEINKGTIRSEEVRKKISLGNKGKKMSEEAKEKIRQAAIKQWERQSPLKLTSEPIVII